MACGVSAGHAGAGREGLLKDALPPIPLDLAMAVNMAGQGTMTATLAGNKLTLNAPPLRD